MKKILVNNNQSIRGAKGIRRYFDSLRPFLSNEFDIEILFSENERGVLRRKLREQFYFLKGNKYDIMWSPSHASGPYLAKKQIVTIHDLIPLHPESGISKAYKTYFKNSVGLLVKNAERIVCISGSVADMVQIYYRTPSSKISIIRNGYDFIAKADSIPFRDEEIPEKYILFVGTLSTHKNIKRLIEAFLFYKKESNDDINLVIVGSFSKAISLGEVDLPLHQLKKDGVCFFEAPSDQKIHQLYTYCHGLVMPSLMEGFGLPIAEAFSYNKPVICSDITVFRELFGAMIRSYFNPYEIESIAESIKILATTDNKLLPIEFNNYSTVSKRTWQVAAKEYSGVFNSIR